jgi:hypothetical protein
LQRLNAIGGVASCLFGIARVAVKEEVVLWADFLSSAFMASRAAFI